MSTASSPDPALAIPCSRCGYDLRMHPADGVCPECEAPVAESRRLALIPVRPAWRDSDPRWRRRMIAGMWVLVLVPLVELLHAFEWDRTFPVPTFYAVQAGQFLDGTFVESVYDYLMFCIGVVLLFSKERHRQVVRLDRTSRWGVVASYGVLVLALLHTARLTALVGIGIGAEILSIRRKFQPFSPELLVTASNGYIKYGPLPGSRSVSSLYVCSSLVVLLACVPLFNALRSTGPRERLWPRVLAATVLFPLAAAAVLQTVATLFVAYDPSPSYAHWSYAFVRRYYFSPDVLTEGLLSSRWRGVLFQTTASLHRNFYLEVIKWLACLTIAVWLSVAQIAARLRRTS